MKEEILHSLMSFQYGWLDFLQKETNQPYFLTLLQFLEKEQTSKVIYPSWKDCFKAFELCSFETVKVVILGQDPYHGMGQANGLAFSVHKDQKIPPSLRNIYQELHNDLGISYANHGDLSSWAKEGVLLLNSVLTVEDHKPNSHQNQGWEILTDAVIQKLNSEKENLVFFLWGAYAQKKGTLINREKHLVLSSAHPSPLSSYRGFFNSRPFSQTNEYLTNRGLTPIHWKIS